MSATDILLIGAGGHAQSCIQLIESSGEFSILGLIGSAEEVGASVLGYRVLGTDADLQNLRQHCQHAVVAIGQIRPSPVRERMFRQLRAMSFEMPTIIAPDAIISRHATIGSGSVVMHGVIVNAGARIGNNCIMNSRCLVEHGAHIGDHSHIATGAIVNGDASVGKGSTLGSSSVLREGRNIGNDCLVGMGLAVRHDLPDGIFYTDYGKDSLQ
jgi:sugar O-acyltransferase (sialic acid O-acetyltransferase NeuD family)